MKLEKYVEFLFDLYLKELLVCLSICLLFKYIHKYNYNLSKDSFEKDKEILHENVILTNFWL